MLTIQLGSISLPTPMYNSVLLPTAPSRGCRRRAVRPLRDPFVVSMVMFQLRERKTGWLESTLTFIHPERFHKQSVWRNSRTRTRCSALWAFTLRRPVKQLPHNHLIRQEEGIKHRNVVPFYSHTPRGSAPEFPLSSFSDNSRVLKRLEASRTWTLGFREAFQ